MPHEPTSPHTAVGAEPAPPAPQVEPGVDPGYTSSGVPTFESVREKIETRYATSIGAAELDSESPEGRSVEEQYEARQHAAADRIAHIRKSMGEDSC